MEKNCVYVLDLTEGKKYVGSTNNLDKRIEEHKDTNIYSSAWLSIYPMVFLSEIHYSKEKNLKILEEEVTFDIMQKYGIDNVRGGAYSKPEMKIEERESIVKLLHHRNDRCLKCGKSDHYINECPNNSIGSQSGFWGWIQTGLKVLNETSSENKNNEKKSTNKCYKCGRDGHWAMNCFAKKHINGKDL